MCIVKSIKKSGAIGYENFKCYEIFPKCRFISLKKAH